MTGMDKNRSRQWMSQRDGVKRKSIRSTYSVTSSKYSTILYFKALMNLLAWSATSIALVISFVLFTKRFIYFLSSCLRLTDFGGNRIFIVQTTHIRYTPIQNAFKYHLFLFGIRVDNLDSIKSNWVFGIDSSALFSIKTSDYLPNPSKSKRLYDRIIDTLKILVITIHNDH